MHGRKKSEAVKTPEELAIREEKCKKYCKLLSIINERRKNCLKNVEVLGLLSTALRLNPDNYSLWNYRRETLLSLYQADDSQSDLNLPPEQLDEELKLTKECIGRNPKSYPAWYQRQWLVSHVPGNNLGQELELCAGFLQLDGRNFHCWNYRQFVVNRLQVIPENEMEFLTQKIEQNFSNYSAWHYRARTLPLLAPTEQPQKKQEILTSELDMVEQIMFTEPDDQSVWWYFQFLISWAEDLEGRNESFSYIALLNEQAEKIRQLLEIEDRCKWGSVTLCLLLLRIAARTPPNQSETIGSLKEECVQLYSALVDIDPTHSTFYEVKTKGLSSV